KKSTALGRACRGKSIATMALRFFKTICLGVTFRLLSGCGKHFRSSGLSWIMTFTWQPLPSGKKPRCAIMNYLFTGRLVQGYRAPLFKAEILFAVLALLEK